MPVDLKLRQGQAEHEQENLSELEYMDKFSKHLQSVFEEARLNSMKAAVRRQGKYDAKVKPVQFEKGDRVLLRIEQFPSSCHRKWFRKYAGVYLIEKRLNDVNYVICRPKGMRSMVVHVDRLKKFW